MKFERICQVTGTLDDFIAKLDYNPDDLIERMKRVNLLLVGKAHASREKAYKKLQLSLLKEYGSTAYVEDARRADLGFIDNAGDSLITRMWADQQVYAEMTLTLTCDGKVISFQIEDNGTGIDPEVESYIFSERIVSKKSDSKLEKAYIGGVGEHMLDSREDIERLGGDIYLRNKGYNKGAIFWYEIPLVLYEMGEQV